MKTWVVFVIIGFVVGFTASSFVQRSLIAPETLTTTVTSVKTVSEKVIEVSKSTLTETVTLIETITSLRTLTTTIRLEKENLAFRFLARPYLARGNDRWVWFNLTVKAASEKGRPIMGVKVAINGVHEAITSDRGLAEFTGVKPGTHKLRIEWDNEIFEDDLAVAFPDIDPDFSYVNLVSENRYPKVVFIAAYYGWYGNEEQAWRHWGNPQNPATKYLPLLGQISGSPLSQSFSLYGFGLDERDNLRLVKRQMALAKMAGISAFAVSWWGPHSFEDKFMPVIMRAAEEVDFKITVIFEPFYKNLPNKWDIVESSIDYLESRYVMSEAWLRDGSGRPIIFTFDIGPFEERVNWKRILEHRNMAWVAHTTDRSILDYGFSYFYEYSPVGIVMAGGDIRSVYMGVSDIPPYDETFIPTVSPRYDDTKVRHPGYAIGDELWRNTVQSTKEVMLHRKPKFVFITSWNEWHESTAIEPDTRNGFRYLTEFTKEFYNVEVSEQEFLKALNILDCLEFCSTSIIW